MDQVGPHFARNHPKKAPEMIGNLINHSTTNCFLASYILPRKLNFNSWEASQEMLMCKRIKAQTPSLRQALPWWGAERWRGETAELLSWPSGPWSNWCWRKHRKPGNWNEVRWDGDLKRFLAKSGPAGNDIAYGGKVASSGVLGWVCPNENRLFCCIHT